jgi:hypothetical protein
MSSSATSKWCRHPAAPGEARALEPVFDNSGVAYGVAYGPNTGPIPAVLSVALVRLGNRSVFQDRSDRPLRHLSAAVADAILPPGGGSRVTGAGRRGSP